MPKFLQARRTLENYHIIESRVINAPDILSVLPVREQMHAKSAPPNTPLSDWKIDPVLTDAMCLAGGRNNA